MKYEKELPMTKPLENPLCDMYTELIIFCARTITFFRNNPTVDRSRHAWSEFNRGFQATIGQLKQHSMRVDEEADMIRMEREGRSVETLEAIKNLKLSAPSPEANLHCYMIPYGTNPRFFGRDKELQQVRSILEPEERNAKLRVMAIHGLPGVGKTQLALQYANSSLKEYDVIAWIPAETQVKVTQALSLLASKLGLRAGDEKQDAYQAGMKVRDWLNTSGRRYLLVFDNVDQIELLLQIWPSNTTGSILITTVYSEVASKRAREVLQLDSFTLETGAHALYALTGLEPADKEDADAADELRFLLGGLPLALDQISDFMRSRGRSYKDFLPLYRKSASKILSRSKAPPEYDHTLSTVWDLHLEKLPQESQMLENLLGFFDADGIAEDIPINPAGGLDDSRWDFLTDEFECVRFIFRLRTCPIIIDTWLRFGEVSAPLIQSDMASRFSSQQTLSIHRMVQDIVLMRLSSNDFIFYFDSSIEPLSPSCPNLMERKRSSARTRMDSVGRMQQGHAPC